ncbi:MAG TPA: DOMON domain-containing protein [Dehalococcoidia bacterium]
MNNSRVNSSGLFGLLIIFGVLLIPAAMLGAACSSPQVPSVPPSVPTQPSIPETPSEPSPPDTTMRPTATWTADGVISSGEYPNANTYGDYELSWRSEEQFICIGLKVKTTGWVAVGIQPGLTMNNADIILGDINNGQVAVYDQYSTGNFGPHPPDEQLGGTNDILEFGGKEIAGYTIIEFKRALDTGDQYDRPLANGSNKIIWAYGSDDQIQVKHSSRGYGEIGL